MSPPPSYATADEAESPLRSGLCYIDLRYGEGGALVGSKPRKGESREDFNARMREYNQRYRDANREKVRAQKRENMRAWRAANPDQARALNREQARRRYAADPEKARMDRLNNYRGLRPGDWQAMWDAQEGLCYLCGEPMTPKNAHVDHDHSHHDDPRKSCPGCHRGLAHEACNQGIGLAGDDPGRLRRWADALESAQRIVRQRAAGAS